jgi:formylglycine-generating enzyme required for sulfatase activity
VPRWVLFQAERCALGTDVPRFSRLAGLHGLPLSLRQPVLNRAVHEVGVPAFALAATCVTNEEFYAFTRARGRPWPGHWSAAWLRRWGRPFPPRLASHPVVDVSAEAARAYCAWSRTRLPAWFEWERAAAGADRRPYPWGQGWCARRCNSAESGVGSLVSADALPAGDSPEGARQLCGNVAEWVVGPHGRFEVRGGGFRAACELWGLAYAFRLPPAGFHAPDTGFRVAADAPPAP